MDAYFRPVPSFGLSNFVLRHAERSRVPVALVDTGQVDRFHQDRHARQHGLIPPLVLHVFTGAVVGPHGLVLSRERAIHSGAGIFGNPYYRDRVRERVQRGDAHDPLVRALRSELDVLTIPGDQPVFVLNRPGYQVYGHWLLDVLPTLWLFVTSRAAHRVQPNAALYLMPQAVPDWAVEMLQLLFDIPAGAIVRYDETTQVVSARRILLVSQLCQDDSVSPVMADYANDIVATVAAPPDPALPKRFFISRRGVQSFMSRSVTNLDAIERVAADAGLSIVTPENLSWQQQVRLFADAELVAGPFGSGLHNTIFSPSTTVSLSLGAGCMNWLQSGIAALGGQRMAYLFPQSETVTGGGVALSYDPVRFAASLGCLVGLVEHGALS